MLFRNKETAKIDESGYFDNYSGEQLSAWKLRELLGHYKIYFPPYGNTICMSKLEKI